MRITGLLL